MCGGELKACSARSNADRTAAGSDTSARRGMARGMADDEEEELISAARRSASAELDAKTRPTEAPREARWRAMARPMPRVAPVTMATRPFNGRDMSALVQASGFGRGYVMRNGKVWVGLLYRKKPTLS
ncbi:hypothetical protein M5K25_019143 [Dendrobium thyrsiflorum]|uniref:Uncharacterized protein n=1 Tax=Dendrobium thyrsiflorum TaxID=117978 RepID=A0ABD0UE72_DENTH